MTAQPDNMRAAFTRADPDQRRQSLIEACARVLAEKGASGVSVRAICTEAGVSPGLLRHYFGGVSEAIAETCRWTGQQVTHALTAAVEQAGSDPEARLLAYLAANFRPPIATQDLLASYVALWGIARSDQLVASARADVYRSFRSELETLLVNWRPEISDPRLPAVALTALIDGLWLELSQGEAPFTPEEAETLVRKWLDVAAG